MKASVFALVKLIGAVVLALTPVLVNVTASAPYDPWGGLDENGARGC